MPSDKLSLSPLAQHLFADQTGLNHRLSLLADYNAGQLPPDVQGIELSESWPAIRDLIANAVAEKLPTLVYGDYDVDGTTSSFMLFRWLRSHGVPGNCFVPSRFKHGYGLDSKVIDQAIGQGYKLLIALDCGTANLDEIAQAKAGGLRVAVIDHHKPKGDVPDVPLLNPQLEHGMAPYCTAGLMYGVITALNRVAGGLAPAVFGDEIELAGLGTIADVVPLEGFSWLLAHEALKRMPQTVNLGLAELIKASGLHSLSRLTAQQASFNLIPRLNAAGRMSNPRIIIDLLSASTTAEAARLAALLSQLNQERRDIVDRVTRQALLQATQFEDSEGLVLYEPDWHIGVLGIIAARVAEQLGKPTVVFGDSPASQEMLTGSVRSNGRTDVVIALSKCSNSIESFGGHSQAAGLKVTRSQLEAFQRDWAEVIGLAVIDKEEQPEALPRIKLDELTEAFERDMWQLAPFGADYEAPRCIISGCRVQRVSYMGKDRTHINLLLSDGTRQTRLVGFKQSHLFNVLKPGAPVEPIVDVDIDNWNNKCAIQLRIIGLANNNGP